MSRYYALRDALRTDPTHPLSQLRSVAISTELSAQVNLYKGARRDGLRQIGETRIAELTVQTVDLAKPDPMAGEVPTVVIDVCYDVSKVDIVDRHGNSVVTDDRPETGWIRYCVSNYVWDSDPEGGWRVASSEDLERQPCAAG